MGQKGIGAAVVIVIVIVIAAAAVGGYLLLGGGGGGADGGAGGGGNIVSATSIDMKSDVTAQGQTITTRIRARNLGTEDMDIRIDTTLGGTDYSFILSGSQDNGWIGMGGQWMSFSDMPLFDFDQYWQQYKSTINTYVGELSGWTGGDYTYTDPTTGYSARIYDIAVNPSLTDSIFMPS